jgi:LysR family glycine cleavage system transcriptional activator
LLEGPVPLHTPKDLEQHMLLHPTRDERDWTAWLAAADVQLEQCQQGPAFRDAGPGDVDGVPGTGVAIGDWSLIGDDLRAGRLVMPFDLKVKTGLAYYLVIPEKPGPSAKLRELTGWLVEQAQSR